MAFMSLLFCSFTGLGLGVNLPSLGIWTFISFICFLKKSLPLLLAFSLKLPSWTPNRYWSNVSFYLVSHNYSLIVTISLSLTFVLVHFLSVFFHFTNSFFNHDSSIKLSAMLLNYILSCLNIGSFFKSAWWFESMLLFSQVFYSIFISLTFYNCFIFCIIHSNIQNSWWSNSAIMVSADSHSWAIVLDFEFPFSFICRNPVTPTWEWVPQRQSVFISARPCKSLPTWIHIRLVSWFGVFWIAQVVPI